MRNYFATTSAIFNLYRQQYPLQFVLLVAFVLRIVAGFFSKGYVFFDDHYCVIEQAQDWIYGFSHELNKHDPPKHSVFYSGLHFYFFRMMDSIGLHSPDAKMTVNRLVHGCYSVLTVFYAYKITLLISTKKNAQKVGLILAALWFMPFLCTKDLVEAVCIPLCMGGFYYLLKIDIEKETALKNWIFAGALFGFAFIFRMHTILFAGGAGLILLYRKYWVGCFLFSFSYILVSCGIQGLIDIYFFEYPLHSVVAYFDYNSTHAYDYITAPFYKFFLVILGFLIPPISIFLIFGYMRTRKIEPIIFTAGLVFFAFHSYFPNKQERFILPLLPLIVLLGIVGWQNYVEQSDFWIKRKKWLDYSWTFFWVINSLVCVLLVFTYSKKSKIEPLVYLSHKQQLNGIIFETANETPDMPPVFYLGRFASTYQYYKEREIEIENLREQGKLDPEKCVLLYLLPKGRPIDEVKKEIAEMHKEPEYIIFSGSQDLEQRISNLKTAFPKLAFETEITPAFYDEVLHFLNPRIHKDQHISIYRTQ